MEDLLCTKNIYYNLRKPEKSVTLKNVLLNATKTMFLISLTTCERTRSGPTFLGCIEENNVKSDTKERRMFDIVLLFQSKRAKNPQKVVPNYLM